MRFTLPEGNTVLAVENVNLKCVHLKQDEVKCNYEQIDTIRFITICFIIWGHSLLGWNERTSHSLTDEIVKTIVIQAGKISTIIFFVISGFLLQPKLNGYSLKSYFQERIPRVYGPWILFILFFMIISIIQMVPLRDLWVHRDIKQFIHLNYAILNGLLLYSAYWFITTYMIGMAIMIGLRKYVRKFWMGFTLLLLTSFYCMNLHFNWIDTNHQKAVLSYTFFIWLGIQIHTYYQDITAVLNKISWPIIILIVLTAFIVACLEGYNLSLRQSGDAYASNRFTNIILSIILFLALLKVGKISIINKLNPRKTVYGIYLIHNIVIFELMMVVQSHFQAYLSTTTIWTLLCLQVCFTLFIIMTTYRVVNTIANSRFRWIIGGK